MPSRSPWQRLPRNGTQAPEDRPDSRGKIMHRKPTRPAWPDDSPAADHAPRRAPRPLMLSIWLFLAAVFAGLVLGAVGTFVTMS
jgi:hypothetical protein